MKRLLPLIALFLAALSCSNDLEFNNPALQGNKNYDFWQADKIQAILLEDGGIKITGINRNETLILLISDFETQSYNLKESRINSAEFRDNESKTFSTLNGGDGSIVIDNYDTVEMTITGSFTFNSYSSDGNLVNFSKGIFYKIPIENNAQEDSASSHTFKATIDTVAKEVEEVQVSSTDNEILINATFIDGTTMQFNMPINIIMGSHTLNASTEVFATYTLLDGSNVNSQFGTLFVIEHDSQFRKIKASFNYNTGHPHNIAVTNGVFIIYY